MMNEGHVQVTWTKGWTVRLTTQRDEGSNRDSGEEQMTFDEGARSVGYLRLRATRGVICDSLWPCSLFAAVTLVLAGLPLFTGVRCDQGVSTADGALGIGFVSNVKKVKLGSQGMEASPATIRRAHAVHPITAVQLEWSLWSRDVEEDPKSAIRIRNWDRTIRSTGYWVLCIWSKGFMVLGFYQGCMERTLITINTYLSKSVKWHIERDAPRLNWHWLGSYTRIVNLNQNLGALTVKLTAQDMVELESLASFMGARMPAKILATCYKNVDSPPLSSRKS
ncbi:hypothetical protein E3N88_16536 [Mikania micrantha]|uniref:Uncharacterized protein n=1 Tax=Mikania micrantha TaxID=192012 RepID=A0A5N6P1A5_9ASTR|nr:hypothetical protein E3N88_16536 [Mikania micrantha]